jgi:hypothetical protein
MTTTDTHVNIVAEGFKVYIGGIEIGQQVLEGLRTDISCRNKDIPKACLMSQTGTISDIFQIGEWLRVGIGNAWAMVFLTEGHEGFRRQIVVRDI